MKTLKRMMVLAAAAAIGGITLAGDIIPVAVHEGSTKSVTLPDELGRDAILRGCSSCPTLRLATNARTEFFIGEVRVSLAAMRLELQRRPEQGMIIRNSHDDRVLLALTISP